MPSRKGTTTFLLAAGSLAGIALWRSRSKRERERVDLYFADGSMVSFAHGSVGAYHLLPLARRVLAAARG